MSVANSGSVGRPTLRGVANSGSAKRPAPSEQKPKAPEKR